MSTAPITSIGIHLTFTDQPAPAPAPDCWRCGLPTGIANSDLCLACADLLAAVDQLRQPQPAQQNQPPPFQPRQRNAASDAATAVAAKMPPPAEGAADSPSLPDLPHRRTTECPNCGQVWYGGPSKSHQARCPANDDAGNPPPDECAACHAPAPHHWPNCPNDDRDELGGDKAQREAGYFYAGAGYIPQ